MLSCNLHVWSGEIASENNRRKLKKKEKKENSSEQILNEVEKFLINNSNYTVQLRHNVHNHFIHLDAYL